MYLSAYSFACASDNHNFACLRQGSVGWIYGRIYVPEDLLGKSKRCDDVVLREALERIIDIDSHCDFFFFFSLLSETVPIRGYCPRMRLKTPLIMSIITPGIIYM